MVALLSFLAKPPLAMAQDNVGEDGPKPFDISPLNSLAASEDGELIVRVYFDDLNTARRIATTFEPLESDYDKGYLLLSLNQTDVDQLKTAGFDVEIDVPMMAFYNAKSGSAPEFSTQTIPGFTCYRTVEETHATGESIAENYPDLATWSDVGDSWEKTAGLGGFDLYVLKLTNSEISGDKPKIFITSSIHAREYTPAELMTRFAEDLVQNYGIDADTTWVLDHHEIHLMLMANPDGRKKAETGLLWRKNTRQNSCNVNPNARGTDLNRNFPFEWNCCGGSSSNHCSQVYHGASGASEPETQAIVSYIQSIFPDSRDNGPNDAAPIDTPGIYLDIHSSGRLMLWPWGARASAAPNGTQLQTLGRKMAYFNGHAPSQSIGLYPTDGTTTSFAYGEMGLASFTYELGTTFFETCNYFENTLIPDNVPSLKYAIRVVREPYITPAGPDTISPTVSSGGSSPGIPAGTTVTLTATVNDTRYNNTNGTEGSQNIVAAEYTIDTPPWQSDATPIALAATDGAFDQSSEGVTGNIDTTGLADGQHIVYVRGQDADGTWGAISAAFLYIKTDVSPPITLGDANCDGSISAVDALFIMQFEVETRTDTGSCPLEDPVSQLNAEAGDVNLDNQTNSVDALFILQCEVDIPNPYCPEDG